MSQIDDPSRLPLERRVPLEPVASPHGVRAAPHDEGGEPAWYKPTYGETAKLLGWRWIYFLPAVLILLLMVIYLPARPWLWQFAIGWWKLILIAIVLPMVWAGKTMNQIIALRKEPFCIHCGYDLTGLPGGHNCPECGRHYDPAMVEEYRRDPNWFIQRYRQRHAMPTADVPFEAGKVRSPRSRDGT
jgi:hypothetical protein